MITQMGGFRLFIMPTAVTVCSSAELAEQERLVMDIGARTVGLFRLDGKVFAYENVCPHQGGPVCQGRILPRVVENLSEAKGSIGFEFHAHDRHIVCPWHGFEFDIRTGIHAGSDRFRLTTVMVEEK